MIIGLVPCKVRSSRLPEKNFQAIGNTTLLDITIRYLLDCSLITQVYVTTDDLNYEGFRDYIQRYPEVTFLQDPPHNGYLTDLFIEFYKRDLKDCLDYLVTTTPDCPFKPYNLTYIIESTIENKLHEYVTFDQHGFKVGSLHIISRYALENNRISGYMAINQIAGVDIHTIEDLEKARRLYESGQ